MNWIDLLRMSSGNLKRRKTSDISDCPGCDHWDNLHCCHDFSGSWDAADDLSGD